SLSSYALTMYLIINTRLVTQFSLFFFFFFFLMMRPPPRSTLFPYPPLFRSITGVTRAIGLRAVSCVVDLRACFAPDSVVRRSEEHTSELQSHLNLVCRLL